MVSRVVTIAANVTVESSHDSGRVRTAAPARLSRLVLGPENVTALAVLQELGQLLASNIDIQPVVAPVGRFERFHPLVICGPTHSGKSHFVQAITSAWRLARPEDTLTVISSADFARDYYDSVESRRLDLWRAAYRSSNLLVIDDLSRFADKPLLQVELLHAMDELSDRDGISMITTRQPLDRYRESLMPGLLSRLASGVTVTMQPPARDTRLEMLQQFAAERRIEVAPAAMKTLAGLQVMPPELFSAVMTLELAAGDRRTIDAAAARQYAEKVQSTRSPSLRTIAMLAARHFALTLDELKSDSRRQAIVMARGVAMLLARQRTDKSLEQIGRFFGGRDHTTVMHGCRKTEQLLKSDSRIQQAIEQLQAALPLGCNHETL